MDRCFHGQDREMGPFRLNELEEENCEGIKSYSEPGVLNQIHLQGCDTQNAGYEAGS